MPKARPNAYKPWTVDMVAARIAKINLGSETKNKMEAQRWVNSVLGNPDTPEATKESVRAYKKANSSLFRKPTESFLNERQSSYEVRKAMRAAKKAEKPKTDYKRRSAKYSPTFAPRDEFNSWPKQKQLFMSGAYHGNDRRNAKVGLRVMTNDDPRYPPENKQYMKEIVNDYPRLFQGPYDYLKPVKDNPSYFRDSNGKLWQRTWDNRDRRVRYRVAKETDLKV